MADRGFVEHVRETTLGRQCCGVECPHCGSNCAAQPLRVGLTQVNHLRAVAALQEGRASDAEKHVWLQRYPASKKVRERVEHLRRCGREDDLWDWVHHPSLIVEPKCNGFAELRRFGLVAWPNEMRGSGWFRVTELGLRFLSGDATIPMYAIVENGHTLCLIGDQVDVDEVAGEFTLSEYIARTPGWSGVEDGSYVPPVHDRSW